MSDSHTERLESALAGRYKVQHKLGEGGMASVYLAEDIKHERNVALKILKPELAAVIGAERFLAEIKTTANLQHPHILPLFDSGEADGFLYYVMPFIDGETLADKLARERQLGVDEAVSIAKDVADALDYAHRNDVLHRDIKPGNILLHDGNPVVADFGIALAISAAGGGRMTETGLSLGTPHYMSPEQASADRDLNARSDVYSLGCVLYEMLAGQPPHTGPSAQSILVRILTEDPRQLTEVRRTVPAHVAATVMKAIEKLPADRFDTAREFMDALEDPAFTHEVRQGTAGTSAGTAAVAAAGPPGPGTSWLADTRSRVAVGLIAVLALLGAWSLLTTASTAPSGDVSVTRFDINDRNPEDDLALLPFIVSVSPDGRHVALVEASLGGGEDASILVRDMDGTELRELVANEAAVFPEFSPDGELVAYAVEGAIKVVPVSGGTPRTILRLDGDDVVALSQWTDDGRLIFTPDGFQSILATPAEGADAPDTLLVPDGGQVMGGLLLPGGRFLVYHTVGEEPRLRIADLEADSSWVLQPEGGAARYLETGHIVYAHPGQSLFALPFDVATGEATGRPVPLVDSVASFFFGRGFDVARNGTLVYSRGDLGSALGFAEQRFVEMDTAGTEQSIALEAASYGRGPYSPDGRRLAFSHEGQIVVFDLATGTTNRLTVDGENYNPVWSPDGTELVFQSQREGSRGNDLYRKRVDGTTEVEQLTSLDGDEHPYTWSAGDTIVFGHSPAGAETDLLMLPPGPDAEPVPFLNAPWDEQRGDLSPDGRWMAYESDETETMEIFVRGFPDASGRWQVSEGGGYEPRWSPDGRGVWYWDWDSGTLMFAEVQTEPTFSVGSRRRVLELTSPANRRSWDLHPDGDRFVLLRSGDENMNETFQRGRFRVVVNWLAEIRAQGLLGEGN